MNVLRQRSRSRSNSRRLFIVIAAALLVIAAVIVRGLVEEEDIVTPLAVESDVAEKLQPEADGHTEAHKAAHRGDLSILNRLWNENQTSLHESDENGWHPLHFAIKGGHFHVVKFLVEQGGADINYRTKDGKKSLGIAKDYIDPDDPIVHYLHTIDGNLFGALNGGFGDEL